MKIKSLLHTLVQKEDLTADESGFLLSEIMAGNVSDVSIGSLLSALAIKGETVDEMVGLINAMRRNMITIPSKDAIDVCGTGGDGKQTFNISTAVSFVVAGSGAQVAKHGNRAASSRCGSADVLEALGVNIVLTSEQAQNVLENVGLVFLFAPSFHPSMKAVSLIRKELGIRTVFNYLGPFCNPAEVTRQLIGVPSVSIAEKLIQVGKALQYNHLVLATSESGLDEISIVNQTYLYELKNGKVFRFSINPKAYGFDYDTEDLQGGNSQENAQIIVDVLNGKKDQKRDIVLLNSGVALYIAGKAKDIHEGIDFARQSIDSGSAKNILENLVTHTRKYEHA